MTNRIHTKLGDNGIVLKWLLNFWPPRFDMIYCDFMYEDTNFTYWLNDCVDLLTPTGSIFVQTDYRSIAEVKVHLDGLLGKENYLNWIALPFDWGGRSDRFFGRKTDHLLWYSKSKDYKFFPDRVQIPKVTAGTGFDKNNKPTKLPTDYWGGYARLSTVSNEKIKGFSYQKPLKLMELLVQATTDTEDTF